MPFSPCKHHITFVSGQVVPSVLAAFLPGLEPSCIHAIVTPEMKAHSRILRDVLKKRGQSYQEHELHDTHQQAIFDLLDAVHATCTGQSLALNLTGGTKLMALAAAEWAYACEVPTFYVDTASDQLVLPGRRWEYQPLPDVLDVTALLSAGGYAVTSLDQTAVPAERRALLRALLELVCTRGNEGQRALQSLNACAQQAKGCPLMAEDKATPTAAWTALLALCEQAGMVQCGNGYLHFPSEAARSWCNGLWFEEYVRMTLYKMQAHKQIRSWASSVQVSKAQVPNELDALFSVRNRLFTIECKTAAMQEKNAGHDNGSVSSMLYKADSLHDRLGGGFARAMLCSVLPPGKHELARAEALGIRIVYGKDLLRLDETLLSWASRA